MHLNNPKKCVDKVINIDHFVYTETEQSATMAFIFSCWNNIARGKTTVIKFIWQVYHTLLLKTE